MAESMSEQIFSIACALSKADESEKSMLRMICTAQEESLVRALKEGVAKEDCESAFICAASWLAAAALESARAGGEEFSSLRAVDEQCWRYLGPADVKIAMGDFVQCGERRYVVRAAGPFYVGEEIAYYWAMLHPKEEEA